MAETKRATGAATKSRRIALARVTRSVVEPVAAAGSVMRKQIDEAIDKKIAPEFKNVNAKLDELKSGQAQTVTKLDKILEALYRGKIDP